MAPRQGLFSPRAFSFTGGVSSAESGGATPPDADFVLQHTESGAGAVSVVDYSEDFKTDELIKISTIFRFFLGHGDIFAQN